MNTDVGSFATPFINGCLDMKEEVEDAGYDKPIESLPDIKYEYVGIKSEEDYSNTRLQNLKDEPVDNTYTGLLTNCFNVKEEIKDMCEDNTLESSSSIKCEGIEIKPEEYHSVTPSQNLKEEPVDSRNECQSEYVKTTNTSKLKRKGKPYDSRDKQHGLNHRVSETIFKCNSCDYQTDREKNMKRHRFKHLPEDQMFKCELCEYKTAYKRDFTLHQLRKHTDIPEEQKFKCDLCDYKTVDKRSFVLHQRRHLYISENQYTCNLCDYKTLYKPYLDYHLDTH